MARVLPIISCDREVIRVQSERLSQARFSLRGLKRAFFLLEQQFKDISSTSDTPSILFQFSHSTLLTNYRTSNGLFTEEHRQGANRNLGQVLTILLNVSPPDADALLEEASEVGRVTVFLIRIRAEFKNLCKNPGDKLCLDSLDNNLLRVAVDFF